MGILTSISLTNLLNIELYFIEQEFTIQLVMKKNSLFKLSGTVISSFTFVHGKEIHLSTITGSFCLYNLFRIKYTDDWIEFNNSSYYLIVFILLRDCSAIPCMSY